MVRRLCINYITLSGQTGQSISAVDQATCQHVISTLSLQRLGHVRYPVRHLAASGMYATTAKVGACALSIRYLLESVTEAITAKVGGSALSIRYL